MMKRFGVSLAVCFAAMIWGAAVHAEETGGVFVMGAGATSCGQFIATIGKIPPGKARVMHTADGDFSSENIQYQQWLEGFLSGYNVVVAALTAAHANEELPQVHGIDIAGMDLWMRNWCNKNPTKTVFDGAGVFIGEMRSNAAAVRH